MDFLEKNKRAVNIEIILFFKFFRLYFGVGLKKIWVTHNVLPYFLVFLITLKFRAFFLKYKDASNKNEARLHKIRQKGTKCTFILENIS